MNTPTDITLQLIALVNEIGGNPEYTRAGGGNASVKVDGILHIKPSGVPLATLRAEDLVPLRIDVLLDALHSDEPVDGDPVRAAAMKAQVGDAGGRRPSVEILFHALIPAPLVLHLHPLTANALTCNENGPTLAASLLGDDAVWVDYTDPGVPLARAVEEAMDAFTQRTGKPAPNVVLLGNHGIIVAGESFEEVASRVTDLSARIRAAIEASPEAPEIEHPELSEARASELTEAFRNAVGAHEAVASTSGLAREASGPSAGPVARGPLIPDQIVYAGSLPLVLDAEDEAATITGRLAAYEAAHGRAPIVAVVPGALVVAVGESVGGAETALATYLDALRVARDADRLGAVRVMDLRERTFIENWEAEAYRRSVAKGS